MPFDGSEFDRHRPAGPPNGGAWWLVWPTIYCAALGYCVCGWWGGRG
jgi:hypothetical protein